MLKSSWLEAQALVFSKLDNLEKNIRDLKGDLQADIQTLREEMLRPRNNILWLKVVLGILLVLILGAWGYTHQIATVQQGRGERITAVEEKTKSNADGLERLGERLEERRGGR